jgi:hypothetical protein
MFALILCIAPLSLIWLVVLSLLWIWLWRRGAV